MNLQLWKWYLRIGQDVLNASLALLLLSICCIPSGSRSSHRCCLGLLLRNLMLLLSQGYHL
jgi:hypothetical protein